MKRLLLNSILTGFLGTFALTSLPATAQGLVPGLLDQSSLPPAPQRPGVASGFTLFNPAELKLPVPAGMRPVPQWSADLFRGTAGPSLRVPPGTVLTGILEDTLASNQNKVGDVFSIRLEEGLTLNGSEIIPKQSKVLGTITSLKAASARQNGLPGTVDVSLQTLVFPDGRSQRLYAFIDHNPAMDMRHKNGADSIMSSPINAGKSSVYSIFGAINHKAGLPLGTRQLRMGQDFQLNKGELLPIRLNRCLDLANMMPSPMVPGTAMVPASVPFGNTQAPMPAQTPVQVPVGEKATAHLLPGLGVGEGNTIFTAPINASTPQSELPEPF